MADWRPFEGEWGVVLGASSGFGAATARELGRRGMSVIGGHLDPKPTLPLAEAVANDVRAAGAEAHFWNVNAADPEKRAQICDRARELTGGEAVRGPLHSLALGTLRPLRARQRPRSREAGPDLRPRSRADGREASPRPAALARVRNAARLRRDRPWPADDQGTARDDARRHGAQPRVLGPGTAWPRAARRREPCLRHDQLRGHARDAVLRRCLGRQGGAGVARAPAGARAGVPRGGGRHA